MGNISTDTLSNETLGVFKESIESDTADIESFCYGQGSSWKRFW
jgi:hypothetical protein